MQFSVVSFIPVNAIVSEYSISPNAKDNRTLNDESKVKKELLQNESKEKEKEQEEGGRDKREDDEERSTEEHNKSIYGVAEHHTHLSADCLDCQSAFFALSTQYTHNHIDDACECMFL